MESNRVDMVDKLWVDLSEGLCLWNHIIVTLILSDLDVVMFLVI